MHGHGQWSCKVDIIAREAIDSSGFIAGFNCIDNDYSFTIRYFIDKRKAKSASVNYINRGRESILLLQRFNNSYAYAFIAEQNIT